MTYTHYIPGFGKTQVWRWIITTLLLLIIPACGPRVVVQEFIVDTSPSRIPEIPSADMNQRLVFAANGDLYTMYASGQGLQRLLNTPAIEAYPAWTPDGHYLSFESSLGANKLIKLAPVSNIGDETWHARLSPNITAQQSAPALSPDGRFVAYSSFRDNAWGIYVTEFAIYEGIDNPVVYNERRLTYNNFFDGHPAWYPDGSQLVYTSDRGLRWQLFKMDSSGGNQESFPGTSSLGSTAYPAWSPDGTTLAFAATYKGDWDIYTLKADGTELTQLTISTSSDWAPAWSPDGQWIAFVSNRGGEQDLYMVSPDASRLVRLTTGPVAESRPAWMP